MRWKVSLTRHWPFFTLFHNVNFIIFNKYKPLAAIDFLLTRPRWQLPIARKMHYRKSSSSLVWLWLMRNLTGEIETRYRSSPFVSELIGYRRTLMIRASLCQWSRRSRSHRQLAMQEENGNKDAMSFPDDSYFNNVFLIPAVHIIRRYNDWWRTIGGFETTTS